MTGCGIAIVATPLATDRMRPLPFPAVPSGERSDRHAVS
jgi:hypothetical protein